MAIKCLLLQTKDKKQFFTFVKNKKQLENYCRTFNAKMFVVKAEIENSSILDISKLVPALCDKNYSNKPTSYEIVKAIGLGASEN